MARRGPAAAGAELQVNQPNALNNNQNRGTAAKQGLGRIWKFDPASPNRRLSCNPPYLGLVSKCYRCVKFGSRDFG